MGCGSSSPVIPSAEANEGRGKANGVQANGNGHKPDEPDDLPTMVLPDTPILPKAPIAFEIPLEEIDTNRRAAPATPPPHVQRLLQPPQPEITLPDIEEKLAEAELRRQTILQQRAASAQKRTQKMMKSFSEMDKVDSEQETSMEHEKIRHPSMNTLPIPPEPKASEDKNI